MTREKVLRNRILAYLQEHKQLTSMEAVRIFGTTRLGARIFELREEGYKIATVITYERDPVTKELYHYGTYIYQGETKDVSSENGWEWCEVEVPRKENDH